MRSRADWGAAPPVQPYVPQVPKGVSLHHTGWGDGGEWDKAYAYFDRAWGNVLANLQKRFADGPIDWTEWRGKLKAMMEEEARKKAGK